MSNSEKAVQAKIDKARQAACLLDDLGYKFEAEQVRVLCRSASSLHSTATLQRKDIDELRIALARKVAA